MLEFPVYRIFVLSYVALQGNRATVEGYLRMENWKNKKNKIKLVSYLF